LDQSTQIRLALVLMAAVLASNTRADDGPIQVKGRPAIPTPDVTVDSTGRLSLHMNDLDIRQALELLSKQGRMSIMVAPAVSGRVTANLEGVTGEQALNAILKLNNLRSRRDGEVVFVYSPQEFKQLAEHDEEKVQGKRELVVLRPPHNDRPNPTSPGAQSPTPTPANGQTTARASSTPLRRHVVREGEDLRSIARLHYGTERYDQALWHANRDRVSSPEELPVGTSLRLPTAATLDHLAGASSKPERLTGRPVAPVDPATRRAGFEAEVPPTQKSSSQKATLPPRSAPAEPQAEGDGDYPIHIVGRFESLRSIARDRLGDSKRASEIQTLNRDVLHTSDRITPGQYLRLPKDAVLIRGIPSQTLTR
jgi:nucleoid-associated protein YgaU